MSGCIIVIIVINGLRFLALDRVPDGFQVDEISSAVTLQCLATEGVTPRLKSPGLFIDLNYGSPKPPTYVYPGVLWVKAFGASIASLRSFSAVWVVLGIIGMFFLAQAVWGVRYGMITALLATASPWIWMFSRVAYESIVGPVLLVWGLFFYLRSTALRDAILSGVLFSLAMYAYPPIRAQVLLLILPLIYYKRAQGQWRWGSFGAFVLALAGTSLPLVWGMLRGDLLGRFQQIGITAPDYLASIGKTNSFGDLSGIFLQNFFAHFNPKFLFVSGDPSLINSTQRAGILGWGEIAGLACLLAALLLKQRGGPSENPVRRAKPLLLLCGLGIVAGVVPSALTNYELPHAYRSIGAWPFYILASGLGLLFIAERWKQVLPGVLAVVVLFSAVFLKDYFGGYAQRSRGMFSPISHDMALAARTEEDWRRFMLVHVNQDYHFQYYLMQYAGDSCFGSRVKWRKLRVMLKMQPE
jgi:hypothetical protein